jgi:UPF0288 family protein (methanogenesis marker protein 3)
MATQAEWEIIETAYINGEGSYKALSVKFNVPLTTLNKRASAGQWVAKRLETDDRINSKVIDKIVEIESTKRVDELFDAIAHLDKVINDCQVAATQVAPKSWESLMSLLLKAIAMRQDLTPKPIEFNDDGWD